MIGRQSWECSTNLVIVRRFFILSSIVPFRSHNQKPSSGGRVYCNTCVFQFHLDAHQNGVFFLKSSFSTMKFFFYSVCGEGIYLEPQRQKREPNNNVMRHKGNERGFDKARID